MEKKPIVTEEQIRVLDAYIAQTNPLARDTHPKFQTFVMIRNAAKAERDGRSISAFFDRQKQRKWLAENVHLLTSLPS